MKKNDIRLLSFIAKVALGLLVTYWMLVTGTELNQILMTH